jgi:hypothetical protein
MPITNEDIMKKLEEIQASVKQVNESVMTYLLDETVTSSQPFAVTPVGSISEIERWIKEEKASQDLPANNTPPVPPEFQVGKLVYLAHDPEKRQVPITQIGDGIVHIDLTDDLKSFINNPDHGGWFYPSSLILVN